MITALLLIDIQNEYFPGGKRPLENPLEAAAKAQSLLDYFRRHKWPTVYIQHVAIAPGANAFLADTQGVEIHPSIAALPGEKLIVKHYPNSFRETGLLEHLKGIGAERLVLCGMMTHMCVDASTRAAVDFGFPTLVAADACATRALVYDGTEVSAGHVHAAFLAALQSYAQVLKTDELLEQL